MPCFKLSQMTSKALFPMSKETELQTEAVLEEGTRAV